MSIDKDEEVYIDEINKNFKFLMKKNILNKIEIKPFSIKYELFIFLRNK